MLIKLLPKVTFFWAFILTSVVGWGQVCVSTAPTVTISNTTSSNTLCKDGTATETPITFTSNSNSSAKAYQWEVQVGNGAWTEISGATSANLSYSSAAPGSNRFRLVVIYCNNSTDPATDAKATSTQSGIITVYEKKEGRITIAASNTNICPGETINFTTSNPANLGATPKYSWRVNGTERGTGATFSRSDLKTEDNVQLFVTSTVPCVDPVESNVVTFTEKPGTPATPAAFTSGETAVCPGTSQTYTVPNDNTASEYIWTLPSGWSGSSTTNSITVTSGNSGSGNITVKARNSCGTSAERSVAVSVKAGTPVTPGAISGTPEVCPGVPQTFSIPAVAGATTYNWTFPTGWTGSSTSTSITLTPTAGSAQGGNLSVTATNDCGTSFAKTLAISVKPGTPAQPAAFSSGPTTLCPGTSATYTVPTVTGAAQYIWTLPNGFSAPSLTTTTPSLVVTAGNSGSGNIIVKGTNDCGTSAERSMAIGINPPIPVMTGNIAGSTGVCANTPSLAYSIPAIANATSYEWSVSGTGWQITAGQGTNEIMISSGSTGGTISVIAKNSCGDSASKSMSVNLNPPAPAVPGTITFSDGTDKACLGTAETYSFTPVQNASGYLWTLPNGTNQTTTTPSLSYTATSAGTQTLKVSANNSCGTSTEKSFQINVAGGKPAQPGTITASKYTVCPPETGFTLTVPPASDADRYEWFLPAGWEITAGKGTNAITVKINASSTYQNPAVVGVEAINQCGNSIRRNTSSNISDANAIAVSNFVYVNLGEDRLLCSIKNQISIDASLNFGGSRLKIASIRSSSGVTLPIPNGNVNTHTISYTPSDTDLANGSVTITLITENPGGACQAGKDEIVLNFRPVPTASITAPAPICAGSSTDLTVTGTPNTILTYGIGTGTDKTVSIGSNGAATINTGALNSTSVLNLRSIKYANEPACPTSLTGSTTITVTPKPTATISYAGTPFCTSATTAQPVTLTKTGTTTGAVFSSTSGLSIDQTTGAINPSSSTPGTYTVTYTIPASGGCEAVTATTQVQIFEKVVINAQPVGDRVCEGETVQLSVTATGDELKYQWFKGAEGASTAVSGATSSELTLTNVSTSNAGSYYVEVSGTAPCAKVRSEAVALVVDKNISISTQPANTVTCLGGTGTLSVGASAGDSTLNYQWYKGTPGSGTAVVGAISATLEISQVTLQNSGSYYVVIDGSENFICEPVTSQTAVLTVRDTPTVEITGTTEVCDGGNTELFFKNGPPNGIVIYTINSGSQQSITLDAAGEAILPTGALNVTNNNITSYTYTLVGVKYPDAPDCSNTTIEGSAVVTVNPTPTANVSFENDQVTFCNNTEQKIFVPNLTGSGANTGGVFSAEGLTVDAQTGSFSPANAAAGKYILKYFLTGSGGCSDLAASLEITIFEQVQITSEPFPVPVCTANSTQLEVAATGDNLSYQWFKVGATSDSEVGTDSPILELKNVTSANAGDYYVVVSGNNACGSDTSQVVTVTVDENIVVTQQPSNQNVCLSADVALTVDATASGSNENIVYRWMYRPAGSTSENDWSYLSGGEVQTLNLSTITSSQAGQYRAEIEGPDGYSCSLGYSAPAIIEVYEAPTADAGAATLEVCSTTSPISLGTDASATNHSAVQWTTTNGQGEIMKASELTEATYVPVEADYGKPIEFILTATLTVDGAELCAETDASDSKVVTIIPQPVITEFSYISTDSTAETGEFCETDTTTYTPHTAGENLANGTGVFSVDDIALTVDSTTGAITPDGTTPGTYIITYRYTASSETAGCTVAEKSFTVTIGEKPSAEFTYAETSFCDNANNPVPEPLNDGTIGTFSSTTGLVFLEGGEAGQVDLEASTPGTYTVTNTVDFEGDGCRPVTFEASITINAQPAAPEVDDLEYCLNEEGATELTATADAEATLKWYDSAEATTALGAAPKPNTAATGTTSYWVSQTSAAGCESERAEINITVNDLPEISITVDESVNISDTGNPVICFGSNIILNGNGGTEYLWRTDTEDLGAGLTVNVSPEVTTTYYITGTDGNLCSNTAEITIEVDEQTDIGTLEAPASVCVNNPTGTLTLTDYTGEILKWETKPATGTTWTAVNGNTSSTLSFSALTVPTDFRVSVKNGVCAEVTSEVRIIIDPLPVGGKLAFPDLVTADNTGRIFMICEGATSGYKPLTLSGYSGSILGWKYSIDGGSWTTIPGENGNYTGSTLSAAQIQALNLPATTVFRVEIGSGACAPNAFSQTAIISVIPTDIEPTPVTVSDDVVCLGEQVTLSSETGYSSGTPVIDGGAFDNAGLKNAGWRFRFNGNDANFETNANNTNPDFWSRATPRSFPTANITTSPYSTNGQVWDAAVEDGNKGFAMVSGRHTATMETPVFGIGSMDQAVLTFDQAYNLTPGATITVEISTDGGATYENVLFSRTGNGITENSSSGNYGSFGSGTPESRPKNKMVLDLGTYLGKNNLRIRFKFVGARTGDIWAVDAIKVPEGPRGVTIEWNDYTNPTSPILIGTTNSVQYIPTKIGLNVFEVKTKLVFDSAGNTCEVAENAENIEVFVFDKYTTSVTAEYGSCGVFEAQLTGKIVNSTGTEISTTGEGEIVPTPDGYVGEWVVNGSDVQLIDPNPADNIPAKNDHHAKLVATSTGTYTVSWTLVPTAANEAGQLYSNPEDCPPVVNPLEVVIEGCTALDFDGVDDYVDLGTTYTANYSFEAWVKPASEGGTIISGPEFNVTAPAGLIIGRWSHVAVTGGKLFINGVASGDAPTGTGGERALIGARWVAGAATEFFHGWIEEVRIWNTAISQEQIQFMMNQRLVPKGAQMGEQIPMNVPGGLTYANLAGYYRLISAIPDPANLVTFDAALKPINGVTIDLAVNSIPGVLKNMETNQQNTAPLPYFSGNNGTWDTQGTWARPEVWKIPNTDAIDWNIVRTSHDIDANREINLLGLISVVNTLNMQGQNPDSWTAGGTGNPLHISHYLLLNGVIDLNGESQLIQPMGSIVDLSSSGHLDRDQQGTASSHNYNYWSSPVSPKDTYNTSYTVGEVLLDGTDPQNPQTINFGAEYHWADGSYTGNKRISTYWLYKFHGTANNYFEWYWVGVDDALAVGEGFSMKGTLGSAAISKSQNYTFRGLPNNGDISPGSTGPAENYLVGNPYPSAIDAKKFIADNLATGHPNNANVFNGTIYFWSHFTNKTHYLEQYVGGYAAYNLSGGVRAVANDARINATGEKGGEEPQQFIPVGQAFFLTTVVDDALAAALAAAHAANPVGNSNVNGGKVIFKNSQRTYEEEDGGQTGGSIFHSAENKNNDLNFSANDEVEPEQSKIWLKFKSPMGYHRQILVTADENASDNFDLGYDAPLIEDNAEDMYWFFNDYEFVIQGVADFNPERELQLGMKVSKNGALTIGIDDLDNVPADMNIYLKDSLHQVIHDLRERDYHTTSEVGVFTDRFKIVFKDKIVVEPEPPVVIEIGEFEILYVTGTREILVKNPKLIPIKSVFLNNLMGQQIMKYYDIPVQEEVKLPVKRFSSGVYIIKVHSDNGVSTKKIILE